MFVDIFLNKGSIDFDQNHSECKREHQNTCNGKVRGLQVHFLIR